jgi:hypothetical protein
LYIYQFLGNNFPSYFLGESFCTASKIRASDR